MTPFELIRQDLGGQWPTAFRTPKDPLPPIDHLSPFATSRTYQIRGRTGQFEFVVLPSGSYRLYDANELRALRLTREGREFETLLRENWPNLPEVDPVKLASLILCFVDDGIKATHRVMPDAEALTQMGRGYELKRGEYERVAPLVGSTSMERENDYLVLRTVTLCGWMHDKRNLGIERIHLHPSGKTERQPREVLSKKIFSRVPMLRY